MGSPTLKAYQDENQPHLKWRVFYDMEGRRPSRKFRTKREALAFFNVKEVEYENLGRRAAQALGDQLKVDAIEASHILRPYGKSLLDAAKFLKQHLDATERSARIDELLYEEPIEGRKKTEDSVFIRAKRAEGKSTRYISDLRSRVKKFTEDHGELFASEVSPQVVQRFLDRLEVGAVSKNNYRRALGVFFSWCERQGYCRANPVAGTVAIKARSGDTEIFTPDEMAKLLNFATTGGFDDVTLEKGKRVECYTRFESGVLANVLLCGFAGIRQAEFERLNWEQVRIDRGKIDLRGTVTKTAARRIVDIQPVLKEWLQEFFPFAKGPARGEHFGKHIRAFRTSEESPTWKHNGLRHSFASYLMETTQNPGHVSLQLGHNDAGIVFQHYRELVTEEDARSFWNLTPKEVLGHNVIEFGGKVVNG